MKKVIMYIVTILVVSFSVCLSIKYDISENGNFVTILSGLWSAASTIVLGSIALYQNMKYKELADESNKRLEDITIMPECYLSGISIHSGTGSLIYVPKDFVVGFHFLMRFYSVNLPIIMFHLVKLTIENEHNHVIKTYLENDFSSNHISRTYLESISAMEIEIGIPNGYENQSLIYKALFGYNNIYNNNYEKEICFKYSNQVIEIISVNKAYRVR